MVLRICAYLSLFLASLTFHLAAETESSPVSFALVHETQAIAPGRPFWVALHLKLEDNWHSYWKNPGDAGMPTSVEWTLPEGFTASPLVWPVPQKFTVDNLIGFGYENEVILLTQITPPETLAADKPVTVQANLRWLVCSDTQCVPGESQSEVSLPVADKEANSKSKWEHLFIRARSQMPAKLEGIRPIRGDSGIEVKLSLPENQNSQGLHADFYPEEKNMIDQTVNIEIAPIEGSPNQFKVILQETREFQKAHTANLKGILVLSNQDKKTIHSVEIDSPVAERYVSMVDSLPPVLQIQRRMIPEDAAFEGGLGMALLFAFLGGMILNLMPCVLPVVSFKILSFVKMAGQSRSTTIKHGLAFFFGVMLSFWVLAGGLLLLQAYGHSVGWGFQLQEPLFVALLAALMLVFGLSMFGVFEMGAGIISWADDAQNRIAGKSSGLTKSFGSGILATLVATPCTGPMLGAALGFASTLSPAAGMLIFTSLGVGMAFPYLILACFPNLLRFLPKPGAWMESFKELMGFLMIATVIWLVWVFGAQTDNTAVILLMLGFWMLALGCWCYGKWGIPVKDKATRIFGISLALIFAAVAGYFIIEASRPSDENTEIAMQDAVNPPDITDWVAFSPEKIVDLQNKGVPVLVDYTAKWCLICQANHMVFEGKEVSEKLASLGVVKMVADWTKNDPVITEELKKFGRSGVPLYLLYTGDPSKPPVMLPQVLTQEVVLEAIKNIK